MSDRIRDTVDFATNPSFAEDFFASSGDTLPVTFAAATHVGNVRSTNEDHFAVLRLRRSVDAVLASLAPDDLPAHEACSYAMVVADGMGGMRSGELASRVALQTMVELAGRATSWVTKLTNPDVQQIEERVEAYVQRIHATLQEQGQSDPEKESMGTTWTSAHLLGRNAVVVHLGDSRAYVFRDGKLIQLTYDETMAQSLIDAGMEAAGVERFRHIVLNCFGGGRDDPRAAIYELELVPGDELLLCTDGLTDMVSDEEIVLELCQGRTPQLACEALVDRALAHGGRDNVTVVLAHVESEMDAT